MLNYFFMSHPSMDDYKTVESWEAVVTYEDDGEQLFVCLRFLHGNMQILDYLQQDLNQ